MIKVVRKELRASELPQAWAAELDGAPDATVRVVVAARPRRDVGRLLRLAKEASDEARRRGLTPSNLRRLLDGA